MIIYLLDLFQVPRLTSAVGGSRVSPHKGADKCYRLVPETSPMNRSVLESELDILWHRFGIEYDVVGTAKNPVYMPLLINPMIDHKWVLRYPPSFNSDSETGTETTSRASDDYTTTISTVSDVVSVYFDILVWCSLFPFSMWGCFAGAMS